MKFCDFLFIFFYLRVKYEIEYWVCLMEDQRSSAHQNVQMLCVQQIKLEKKMAKLHSFPVKIIQTSILLFPEVLHIHIRQCMNHVYITLALKYNPCNTEVSLAFYIQLQEYLQIIPVTKCKNLTKLQYTNSDAYIARGLNI